MSLLREDARPNPDAFIERENANHSVALMTRLLKVSKPSTSSLERDVANAAVTKVNKAIHADRRQAYGARSAHTELLDEFLLHVTRHRGQVICTCQASRRPPVQGTPSPG